MSQTPTGQKPTGRKTAAASQPTVTHRTLTPKQVAVNKARALANAQILEKYKKERDQIIVALVKEAGFEWTPAPTKAEKAEAEIRALIQANPELADKFTEVPNTDA